MKNQFPRIRSPAHPRVICMPAKLTAGEQLNQIKQASDLGASLLATLAKEVGHDVIIATLKDMLTANTVTKAGKKAPDWRAREAGVKMYLAYMVGMPVQRSVTIERKEESEGETMTRLLESPAAREALKRAMAQDGEVLEA